MNLNKVFILGNVTSDPATKALPSGLSVSSFSIATNRFFTDKQGQKQQQAEFHNIVAFGKLADTISSYLTKGSLVLIEGRIQTRSWQDTAGIKKYRTEIITEKIQLGPKGDRTQQTEKQTESPKEDIPIIDEEEIDVKDIPL